MGQWKRTPLKCILNKLCSPGRNCVHRKQWGLLPSLVCYLASYCGLMKLCILFYLESCWVGPMSFFGVRVYCLIASVVEIFWSCADWCTRAKVPCHTSSISWNCHFSVLYWWSPKVNPSNLLRKFSYWFPVVWLSLSLPCHAQCPCQLVLVQVFVCTLTFDYFWTIWSLWMPYSVSNKHYGVCQPFGLVWQSCSQWGDSTSFLYNASPFSTWEWACTSKRGLASRSFNVATFKWNATRFARIKWNTSWPTHGIVLSCN